MSNDIYQGPTNTKEMLEQLEAGSDAGTLHCMTRDFNAYVARQQDKVSFRDKEMAKAIPTRANVLENEYYVALRERFRAQAQSEFEADYPACPVPERIERETVCEIAERGEARQAEAVKAYQKQKAEAVKQAATAKVKAETARVDAAKKDFEQAITDGVAAKLAEMKAATDAASKTAGKGDAK